MTRVYSRLKVGGIEHQMLKVLPRLGRGRYRPSLVLLEYAGEMADRLREQGLDVQVIPFRSRLHPASLWRLASVFRRSGARIVHAHVRESNISATVAGRLARVPVVIAAVHNMDTVAGRRRILQERVLDRWRDATVAVSERVRRNYCETVGIDPEKVVVIYNGIDTSTFDSLLRDRAPLEEMGVPPGDGVVICVSRLVSYKGHDVLLRAAGRVIARAPRTTFILVGEGDRLQSLSELAGELGIESKVVFAGKRNDVPRLLRASDVSVLTSIREGFSNVVLESLAARLPVVATDVGGNGEAIEEGICGFLLPPGDVEGIADRLLRLLMDDDLRARFGQAARRRAERFSLDETVLATEALYDRLLAAAGGRARRAR